MSAVRNYAIVTSAYFLFTITDGALRMLVLLHFYSLGYTPFVLAFLFLLYETAGIFANVGGGWLASRFGIPRMLAAGQILQIFGLCMLSALNPDWGAVASVVWVVLAQGIAGVAKDLTKTASKSAIKATSQEGAGQLFRWVAWFTGSKNATKGAGFFIGGLLLQVVGFRPALWLMAAMLGIVLVGVMVSLPRTLGKAKSSKSFRELFAKTRAINLMAAARNLHVRFARCLVRRRPAGISLRLRLAVHAGGRIRRSLDHRVWRGTSSGACGGDAEPRWSESRGSSSTPVGRNPDGNSSGAGATPRHARRAAARPGVGGRPAHIWLRLCGDIVAAFLPDPGLCRVREGG